MFQLNTPGLTWYITKDLSEMPLCHSPCSLTIYWYICDVLFLLIFLILLHLFFLLLFLSSLFLLLLILRLFLLVLLVLLLLLLLLSLSSSSPPPSMVFLDCSGFSRLHSIPLVFPIYSLAFQLYVCLRQWCPPKQFDDSPYDLFTELGSSAPIPNMEDQTLSLSLSLSLPTRLKPARYG